MSLSPRLRRLLWVAVVGLLMVGGSAIAARFWLGGYLVRTVLRMGGASEIRFTAVRGTPWHFEVDGLSFRFQSHACSARRVVLDRTHWWSGSLGAVRVEGAEVAVYLDDSDIDPFAWTPAGNAPANGEPVNLPVTTLDLEGRLVVRMAMLPDMTIDLKLEGRPKGNVSWIGNLQADGPGFRLAGTGSLLRAGQELEFQVLSSELDLAVWSRHVQRLVPVPGGPWELGGKLNAVAEGNVTARRFASIARVSLQGGRMRVLARDIAVTDAEADLEFSDLWKYRTKAGELRLGELRTGRLAVRDIKAAIGLRGSRTIAVDGATGRALGGTVTVAPFHFQRDQRELILNLRAEGLAGTELLGLTTRVPGAVAGRFDAVLPLRIQTNGVRFEPGAVTLASGAAGTMELNTAALLRSGEKLDENTANTLKAAESEFLRVRLDDLRLDIRASDLPLGSSARVSFRGEADHGPVAATLNINGAIERYLQVMERR
jgi:hypothetical protein